MSDLLENRDNLINVINEFQKKYELSKTIDDTYFEPGMMENLDQYLGIFDQETNTIRIRTEVKGLRYDNRTQMIENMKVGDQVYVNRESDNAFNPNNFSVHKMNNECVGNLPAELCNALAPLFDMGYAKITDSFVSYIEKLSERSRYARQGVLFLEIGIKLIGI